MKLVISALLVGASCLFLTACGGEGGGVAGTYALDIGIVETEWVDGLIEQMGPTRPPTGRR